MKTRALLITCLGVVMAGCGPKPVVKPDVKEEPKPVEQPKVEAPKPLEFSKTYFAYNKADIRGEYRDGLKAVVDTLLGRPDAAANIEGHCDERGTDEYNMELGWKRAYAVRDYLKRLGVDEKRLFPISYGRSRPAVVGTDESAWSKNRRVELTERK